MFWCVGRQPLNGALQSRARAFFLRRRGAARFKLAVTLPADLTGLSNGELQQLLLEQQQLLLKALSEKAKQKRLIAELREEVARLKLLKGRPPSNQKSCSTSCCRWPWSMDFQFGW
jgi:hypothetical protein